ncbi:hypothetical protein [Myroides marinus]|uniref:hypothetical protein n=1 Tax=Myroides marinus TaxID=703342 RepID=UPI0025790778|nr:hypothetical protein [Myroides marinus]MDM1378447.1 hypothetical protein [Myroides marinus]MDM1385718.1 hypothetical protein [Myroides marinus]MDM1392931.1 hypothetical protein [Myroides marinus]
MNNRKLILYSLGIGVIITLFIYFAFLEKEERNIINFISFLGTFISFAGLYIAYDQIIDLKQQNEATRNSVEMAVLIINQNEAKSDLVKAIKIIDEIQTSNQYEKYELSLLRMKDLKNILLQTLHNNKIKIHIEQSIFKQHLTNIGIDIANLNDLIIGRKKGINNAKLNSNLENLSTILNEIDSKLKFENYDRPKY